MADAPFELYDGTALEWVLDGDELRVEVDEAVARELEAMLDEWRQTALRSRAGLRPHGQRR